jgi:hypothetical protein
LSDDNFSSVLNKAIQLSHEDQKRLIKNLIQQSETTSHDLAGKFSKRAHSAEVQPVMQKQSAANCEVDNKQSHWDFTVEDGLYGKLICSYHLEEDFLYELDVVFSNVVSEQKRDRTVVNVNHAILCREEVLILLREKIERNIHDAMEGLIYEVRLQVLRAFNGWHFFINFNPTEQLQAIREFYIGCVNDRMNAHQGRGPKRENFLRKIIAAYAGAAEKANKKAAAAAKGHKNARPGKCGIRLEVRRVSGVKHEFYGKVTKAALAREMELAGHRISQSVLLRQLKRYKIELSDLEKLYDDERIARERK